MASSSSPSGHTCSRCRALSPNVFPVPSRPPAAACQQGTLRDQLIYPHTKESRLSGGSDAELVRLLNELDLTHLLACHGGLDAEEVWQDVLSVGEQQRIGFIRLLYHRPAFAFLDESTSALDVALEAKAYGLTAELGITVISIALPRCRSMRRSWR